MNYQIIPVKYEYKKDVNVSYFEGYGLLLKNKEMDINEVFIDLTNHIFLNRDAIKNTFDKSFIYTNQLDGFEKLTDEEIYKLQDNILEFLNVYYTINYLSQQVLMTYQYMEKEKPFDKKYKGIHKLLEKGYMKNSENINEFFDKECANRRYGDRLKRRFNELRNKKNLLENKKYMTFISGFIKREFED